VTDEATREVQELKAEATPAEVEAAEATPADVEAEV
jgi:hypothetical protein